VKKQTTLRDNIYQMMDALIHHSNSMGVKLPAITLTSAQYQIFQDFNDRDREGNYYYRNIEVKSR